MADEEIIKHSEINDVKLSAAAGGAKAFSTIPSLSLTPSVLSDSISRATALRAK